MDAGVDEIEESKAVTNGVSEIPRRLLHSNVTDEERNTSTTGEQRRKRRRGRRRGRKKMRRKRKRWESWMKRKG